MRITHPDEFTAHEPSMTDEEYEEYRNAWYATFCGWPPGACMCLGPPKRRSGS